jgi:hypothetical protein
MRSVLRWDGSALDGQRNKKRYSRWGIGTWRDNCSCLAILVPNPKTVEASDRTTLLKLAIAVALAFGVTAMIRFALSPLVSSDAMQLAAPVDADVALRSRMAPIVRRIGSAAIILLALGLIIEFGILDVQPGDNTQNVVRPKIDTLLTGVFASVLPVFATWVGTVLAFYFTNESFRQAAQAARDTTAGLTDRLRAIPARTATVPRARMVVLQLPTGGSLDSTVLKDIDKISTGNLTLIRGPMANEYRAW